MRLSILNGLVILPTERPEDNLVPGGFTDLWLKSQFDLNNNNNNK